MPPILNTIEDCIVRDPAGRGLLSGNPASSLNHAGHLGESARHLAMYGRGAILVTGFFIPHGEVPACETDGPIGTAFLAAALNAVGIPTRIVTDAWCGTCVTAAAEFLNFDPDQVVVIDGDPAEWLASFQSSTVGRELTHLIAVERVGPSHTETSIALQYPNQAAYRQEFAEHVPMSHRDRCHNMRGQVIDDHTAPLHRMFEQFAEICPDGRTIGIGDGGNEIGMGSLPWHVIRQRLSGKDSGRVVCRIATDWTILAGVSNWGAMALAASVLHLRQRLEVLKPWTADFQERMLEAVVQNGPAVDGITGRAEPTVDGLPFVTYIQPWEAICRLLS